MSSKSVTCLAAAALFAATAAAFAQDGSGRLEIARVPGFAALGDTWGATPAPGTHVTGEPHTGAATGDQPLVENGWDFTRPETIPGFGPWQPTGEVTAAKPPGPQ